MNPGERASRLRLAKEWAELRPALPTANVQHQQIAGPTGEILADAGRDAETIVTATVDLDAIGAARNSWGMFRDRRPDLYGPLLSLDGNA